MERRALLTPYGEHRPQSVSQSPNYKARIYVVGHSSPFLFFSVVAELILELYFIIKPKLKVETVLSHCFMDKTGLPRLGNVNVSIVR